jgi:hypothetical protein
MKEGDRLRGAMPGYRVYKLTPDGHVDGLPDVIDCQDDDEAVALARSQQKGNDLEVWQGERRVAVLKTKPT